jgi:hypothetical protein
VITGADVDLVSLVVLGFLAFLAWVYASSLRNAERRRTLLFAGLGVFCAVLGLVSIAQGQVLGGVVGLALAGIELSLFALIRASRPRPGPRA